MGRRLCWSRSSRTSRPASTSSCPTRRAGGSASRLRRRACRPEERSKAHAADHQRHHPHAGPRHPAGLGRHRRVPHRRGRCRGRRAGRKRRDRHQRGRDDPRSRGSSTFSSTARSATTSPPTRPPSGAWPRGFPGTVSRRSCRRSSRRRSNRSRRGMQVVRDGRPKRLPRRRAARPPRGGSVSQPEEEGRAQSAVPPSADAGGGWLAGRLPRACGW